MDQQATDLPIDIVEHIISYIPDPDVSVVWLQPKDTLLTCALVCKTWTSLARRRLLSVYFPMGRITIEPHSQGALILSNAFQSPLRTIDPVFVKVLDLVKGSSRGGSPPPESLFLMLSPLNATLFLSIHTLQIDSSLLPFNRGGDGDTSPLPVLSQIKFLLIYISNHTYFKDIAEVIRLCPSIEEVTAYIIFSDRYQRTDPNTRPLLPPPMSLRKLDLDAPTLLETILWMTTCQPRHTNISSLSISCFLWDPDVESIHLQEFLDMIGPNLEELSLGGNHSSIPFTIRNPEIHLKQFTNLTSLKRFTLRAGLDVATEVASYFLKHTHFAPELETLEIAISTWEPSNTNFAKLKLVDEQAHSRNSLRRVVVSHSWGGWRGRLPEEEYRIRECLPRCEGKGIIELR